MLSAVIDLGLVWRRFWSLAAAGQGMGENDLAALLRLVDRGSLTGRQLRQSLGLSSGSVSELVDRLERRGAVAKSRHERDRREVQLRVTPRGRRIAGRALSGVRSDLEELVRGLGHQPAAAVVNGLWALCEMLAGACAT
jgi:DNA-binding MarR family transcriptional regulator